MVCEPKESGTSAVSPTTSGQTAGTDEDPPKTGAKCSVTAGANPSPAALAMLGFGLALAGLGRRRRRG